MQDLDRPCDHRDPVKTPVELARERGEEPPEKTNFFSAARRARMEKRKAQNEQRQAERLQQGQQQFPQTQQGQHAQQGQQRQQGQGFARPVAPEEEHGFRLPENEQPDHQPEKPAQQKQVVQPEQQPQPEQQRSQDSQEPQARYRRGEMPEQTFPWDKHNGGYNGNESGGQHRQEDK